MTSRLPRPRPEVPTVTPDQGTLQTALQSLGAPHLSPKDLGRLNRGSMAQVIAFATDCLSCPRVRAPSSHQSHQNKDQSMRTESSKAFSRLAQAKKTLQVHQTDLETRQEGLSHKLREVEQLRHAFESKKRIKNMLDLLEQKQSIRVKRIEEIAQLLERLTKGIDSDKSVDPIISPLESLCSPAANEPPQISHTRDTFTTLHAYHLHLCRIQTSTLPKALELEETLREQMASILHMSPSDPEVGRAFERCIVMARVRARRSVHFKPEDDSKHIPWADLDSMLHAVIEKEDKLHNLSDHSLSLGYMCDHYIKLVSAAVKLSMVLVSSLEEEAKGITGWVTVFQSSIIANEGKSSSSVAFGDEVREVCGLDSNVATDILVEIVKAKIHERKQSLK